MKNYRNIFFDLDHTLWDFERNSAESLNDLFELHKLQESGIPDKETFSSRYRHYNEIYWGLLHKGKIGRGELRWHRFRDTLADFEIKNEELVKKLSADYLEILPTKTNLFDDTLEILEYLLPKYALHIITNGFEEVQHKKIRNSDIEKYFRYIITSEMAGYQKPDRLIFKYALEKTNAVIPESIFVGDSIEADMDGAKSVGMDHVFYNPNQTPHKEPMTFEIRKLSQLKEIL